MRSDRPKPCPNCHLHPAGEKDTLCDACALILQVVIEHTYQRLTMKEPAEKVA